MSKRYNLTEFNIKMLRKIEVRILNEPLQFVMSNYFRTRTHRNGTKIPNCHTAACIAGHALSIKAKLNPKLTMEQMIYSDEALEAAGALKMPRNVCKKLFFLDQWPAEFYEPLIRKDVYNREYFPEGSVGFAAIAAARIEHFIKTNGRE